MLYLVKYQYYDLHRVRPFSGDSSEGIGNSTVCVCVCSSARTKNRCSAAFSVLLSKHNTWHGHNYSYCLSLIRTITPGIVGFYKCLNFVAEKYYNMLKKNRKKQQPTNLVVVVGISLTGRLWLRCLLAGWFSIHDVHKRLFIPDQRSNQAFKKKIIIKNQDPFCLP